MLAEAGTRVLPTRKKLLFLTLQFACIILSTELWWPSVMAADLEVQKHQIDGDSASLTGGVPCRPWPHCVGGAINWTRFFSDVEAMGECERATHCSAADRVKQLDTQQELGYVWERRLANAEAAIGDEEDEFWRDHLHRLSASLHAIELQQQDLWHEDVGLGGEYISYIDSLSADSVRTRVPQRASKSEQRQAVEALVERQEVARIEVTAEQAVAGAMTSVEAHIDLVGAREQCMVRDLLENALELRAVDELVCEGADVARDELTSECRRRCERLCELERTCHGFATVRASCFFARRPSGLDILARIPGALLGTVSRNGAAEGSENLSPLENGPEQPRHSAGHKLCVIVPFRNGCGRFNQGAGRDQNLDEFMRHMPQFLEKAGVWSHRVVVVEQSQRGLFNKGLMFNVGVKHAEAIGCDYMVMNDVDHLPIEPKNNHAFPDVPVHLCTKTDMKGFKLYERMVGGALLVTLEQYKKFNGYSNMYFGWGQEDDDMFERIRTVFKKVKHIDQKVGKYHALTHGRVKDLDVTVNFDANAKRLKEMRKAGTRQLQLDGFNTADEYHKVIATLHGPFTETRREDRWSDMTIIVGTDYEHLLVDVLKDGKRLPPCDDTESSANATVVAEQRRRARYL